MISLNSVLLLLVLNFAGINVYIPQHKYQVKPHQSLWFSAACAAAIAHRSVLLFIEREIQRGQQLLKKGF